MVSKPCFSKDEISSSQFGYLEDYYFLMLVNSEFQGTRVSYLSYGRVSSINSDKIFWLWFQINIQVQGQGKVKVDKLGGSSIVNHVGSR